MYMRRISSLLVSLAFLAAASTGLASSQETHGNEGNQGARHGQLVDATLVASYSEEQVAALVKSAFTWPGQDISELVSTATAVDAFAITFRTEAPQGRPITASGLVAVPSPADGVYPVVQYHHGTQFDNFDVPSSLGRSQEGMATMALFAGHGYVASMPDYIGQGGLAVHFSDSRAEAPEPSRHEKSGPSHPYLHAGSMAISAADMLKAVSELSYRLRVRTSSRLFICGLSEGGHATMALQRHIERNATAQPFRLTASGPMAGPYDVRACWRSLSESGPPGGSPLALQIYLSYAKIYRFDEPLREVFNPPWPGVVGRIDDGRHNGNEMYWMLPKTLQGLMDPDFLAAVAAGKNPVAEAMDRNLTSDFPAVTPTRLYHAEGDELVPFGASVTARDRMKALGAVDVQVVDVGAGVGHVESFVPSMLMAKKWFDTFNKPATSPAGNLN